MQFINAAKSRADHTLLKGLLAAMKPDWCSSLVIFTSFEVRLFLFYISNMLNKKTTRHVSLRLPGVTYGSSGETLVVFDLRNHRDQILKHSDRQQQQVMLHRLSGLFLLPNDVSRNGASPLADRRQVRRCAAPPMDEGQKERNEKFISKRETTFLFN